MFITKLKERSRVFPCILYHDTCMTSPIINIPQQSGIFVIVEPPLTHKSSSEVHSLRWLTPVAVQPVGLDKYIMMYFYHCEISYRVFLLFWKSSVLCLFIFPFLPIPDLFTLVLPFPEHHIFGVINI